MKKVVLDFSPDGSVKLETKGFSGSECRKASGDYEKALGVVAETKATPEMRSVKGSSKIDA